MFIDLDLTLDSRLGYRNFHVDSGWNIFVAWERDLEQDCLSGKSFTALKVSDPNAKFWEREGEISMQKDRVCVGAHKCDLSADFSANIVAENGVPKMIWEAHYGYAVDVCGGREEPLILTCGVLVTLRGGGTESVDVVSLSALPC